MYIYPQPILHMILKTSVNKASLYQGTLLSKTLNNSQGVKIMSKLHSIARKTAIICPYICLKLHLQLLAVVNGSQAIID